MEKHVVSDYIVLDPSSLSFVRDSYNKINLSVNGNLAQRDVRPAAAFPLTAPRSQIMISTAEGAELGFIENLDSLDKSSETVLSEELDRCALATKITRIDDVKSSHGVTTWRFATDRGPRTAYVKDRGDIRWLDGGKAVMTDVNGLKFVIPQTTALDERSRLLLEEES
jgi:hypothetical protein